MNSKTPELWCLVNRQKRVTSFMHIVGIIIVMHSCDPLHIIHYYQHRLTIYG